MLKPDAPRYAQSRGVRSCRALALGFALAFTGEAALSQAKAPVRFSIPAQPLAAALDAYSAVSGLELFYDGALAVDRRSSAVEGLIAPEAALRDLLAGSGLVARATGPDSVTIARASPSRVADTLQQSYFAAIQARVSQALCGRAETRPGNTDLLIRLWISSSGTVQRALLLDAPDDVVREDAVAAVLNGLSIGVRAPEGIPQPVTMAILARAEGEPTGCPGSTSAAVH